MTMDAVELKEKIDIVFSQELNNRKRGLRSYSFVKYGGKPFVYDYNPLINSEPNEYNIEYESMETLKKLYFSIEGNDFLKREFISILCLKIEKERAIYFNNIYYDTTDLAFATLIYTNNIDTALEYFSSRVKNGLEVFSYLSFIKAFVHNNYHYLNNIQLKFLKKIISNSYPRLSETEEINQMIDQILFNNLNRELEGINFEINQDERKVFERIKYYNFDKNIENALREIDSFIYLENSKTITSGMVKNFREIFAILVENIALKIEDITKENFPQVKETKIGNLRLYVKKHLNLSDRENKFIDSFINILHIEGGHSFMSEKEYFRLARNIFIIIAYFLLSKLDKFMKK